MPYSKVRICARILLSIMLGIIFTIGPAGWLAVVQADTPSTVPLSDSLPAGANNQSLLPFTYARVITNEVQVYDAAGLTPVRSLGTGYLWVSLASTQPITQNDQSWYVINENEVAPVNQLAVFTPSTFQGVELAGTPDPPFAWMIFDMWTSKEPGVPAEKGAPLLKRYTRMTIFEEQTVGERTWYRVGPEHWIEQGNLGLVKPSTRPEGVGPDDQWIEVNLYEQTLAAYEGDRMVYATLVSSGLPQWETQSGLFRVWLKMKLGKMSGREGYSDYYFLEDVPWSLYFNQSYALHGAYWHDKFGLRHSHGCVNLSPKDARWLFDWATPATGRYNFTLATADEPGTWVWVHQ